MSQVSPKDALHTAGSWKAISPSDTAKIEPFPRSVYVGGAGTVIAVGQDGVSAPFVAVAGATLPIQPTQVLSTGTTATNLVALY